MFVLDGAELACARSTCIRGFGRRGINTGGAAIRVTSRSGCSKGRIISVAATAHCREIDVRAVNRCPEET
jgi:hypothetical protein